MPLAPGMRLGVYDIIAAIGAGGMGEVYRARDARLQREVAVKVLPDAVANDPGRLARFEREALVLASLNHPNIAHVYGLEDARADGVPTPALIMELVEGPTLADLIARGPLPLDQALDIARQIAEALDAAHERGIVHRDLKPANVKVRPDGVVKVLDFGLAKALEPAGAGEDASAARLSNSPTFATPAMTQSGVLLGTAAYMSPEQVRGGAIDKRADVWAFGCVLHEMLAGSPPFAGDTISDTIAAVLRADVDRQLVPSAVPLRIRRLLERCLERDARRRLRDIGDALAVLEEKDDPREHGPAGRRTRPPVLARLAWIAAGVVLGAAATALLAGRFLDRAPAVSVVPIRFAIEPPAGYDFGPVRAFTIALSPDSRTIAAIVSKGGTNRVMLRSLDDLTPRLLPGSDGASDACFSPDGSHLAIYGYGLLKKANLAAGGQFVTIAASPDAVGIAWGPDDRIVLGSTTSGLLEVSAAGGEVRPLTALAAGELHHDYPVFLPGGKALLYTSWRQSGPSLYLLTPDRHSRLLVSGARQAWYSGRGTLVYQSEAGNLSLAPFDLASLRLTGSPRQIVTPSDGTQTLFTVSARGDLAYDTGNWSVGNEPVWVDRHGKVQAIPMPRHRYNAPRLSPDGTRLAIETRDGNQDIWVYDLARATMTRLTFDPGEDESAVWSPDGRTIAYKNERVGEILTKASDGSGSESTIGRLENPHLGAWSPDGRWIAVNVMRASNGEDLDLLDVRSGKTTPFIRTPANEVAASFSPDGRWLAYASDESGQ